MSKFNMESYQHALRQCLDGPELEERGQKYRTWDAAHVVFSSVDPMLFNFPDRKLNPRYAVEEFLWYCRGDRRDASIEAFANAWKKLAQPDGAYFSNYGHYIFAKMGPDGVSMFQFAAEELQRNPASRRAAFPLLETVHCFHANSDMVCTFGIQFFIRPLGSGGVLDMIVNMRSNDAVWGLTNDAFCFSMLHRLMHAALRFGLFPGPSYPDLVLGSYHHIANTMHVYERHYEMARKIVDFPASAVPLIDVPPLDRDTAEALLNRQVIKVKSWNEVLGL